jgi:hypothetical protein
MNANNGVMMRGLVFTEFLEFVETTAGADMVETMLESCALVSGGAYTAVGTYDHREILTMLAFLNTATGQAVSEMVTAFGQHLFGQLIVHHSELVKTGVGLLDFLEGIETHIHREVRKLYPDAELPFFEAIRPDKDHLTLNYHSARPFAGLAHGMLSGAVTHFKGRAQIERIAVVSQTGYAAQFNIELTR